ncbi:hypothetical protein JFL43_19890 [Viridibacillus sp. YIM B01967]|uniref:ABC transporter permease n=1 Tax=Viridibacillus soli TaxID=2798301 RepID=A0ABS1HC77_9BACL|nr:hypothetical protein [Viridibacillus soli]MBK3497056.1 hypothetical protein [Viridibacillus soli]
MLKLDLKKLVTNRLVLPSIIVVIVIWVFTIFHKHQSGSQKILENTLSFWNVLGSLTVGFLILFVTTRLFAMDREEQVEEVIHTTKLGRRTLFLMRIKTATIFMLVIILLFTCIQLVISVRIFNTGQRLTLLTELSLWQQTITVLIGTLLFTIFTALICDSFKSHPITLIICGLFFGLSYLIRGSMIHKYSLEWILEKGFFSFLIKGELFRATSIDVLEIGILALWYSILIIGMYCLNKHLRARRKEI